MVEDSPLNSLVLTATGVGLHTVEGLRKCVAAGSEKPSMTARRWCWNLAITPPGWTARPARARCSRREEVAAHVELATV